MRVCVRVCVKQDAALSSVLAASPRGTWTGTESVSGKRGSPHTFREVPPSSRFGAHSVDSSCNGTVSAEGEWWREGRVVARAVSGGEERETGGEGRRVVARGGGWWRE